MAGPGGHHAVGSMGADFAAGQAEALLASLLPASVDHYIVGSMPIWGGPVMLIIGGMVAAGDYRNGTLRSILARFADRRALLLGRYAAVVLVMLIVSITSLIVGAVCSTVVSLAEARPLVFPSFGQFLTAAGALWLVEIAWASVGFALGIVTRNVGATIGIGLLWTLLVENVLGSLLGALDLNVIRAFMLGPASAAIAQAQGGDPSAGGGFAITAATGPGAAVAVLLGYAVLSLAIALLTFERRDVV